MTALPTWSLEADDHPHALATRRKVEKMRPFSRRLAPLRRLAYGIRSGGAGYSIVLTRALSHLGACPSGAIHYRGGADEAYYAVLLGDGRTLEGVQWNDSNRELLFYLDGDRIGSMVEGPMITHPELPWWKRPFCTRREWSLLIADRCIGQIQMQYPVSRGDRIPIEISDGGSLFVTTGRSSNASRHPLPPRARFFARIGNRKPPVVRHRDFVIPRQCRCDEWFTPILFHISVAFRVFYCTVGFS
jgi:hypothetical protein